MAQKITKGHRTTWKILGYYWTWKYWKKIR